MFVGIVNAQVVSIPDANFKAALITLGVDTNSNGQIEVSEALARTTLDLQSSSIADLTGIKSFTNLTSLNVTSNSISTLDVSGLSALTSVPIYAYNPISILNTSGCSALTSFNSYPYDSGNITGTLTSLDLSNCSSLTSLNLTGNTLLNTVQISGCTALAYITCNSNTVLPSLNASGLSNLTSLSCTSNPALTSITVTGDTALTTLTCNNNALSSMDVSGLTNLQYLNCFNNALTSLDVSTLTKLVGLYCQYNQLTTLSVTGKAYLTGLNCSYNLITNLNFSNCTALASIPNYTFNPISILNASGCTALTYFYSYFYNGGNITGTLTSLVLSNCNGLTGVDLTGNTLLNSVQLSGCTALTSINCANNSVLPSLNASGLTNLTSLSCTSNPALTSITVTGDTRLTTLTCNNNALTSLSLITNTLLANINCSYNNITSIDLQNNEINAVSLNATNNDALYSICIDTGDTVTGSWSNGVVPSTTCIPKAERLELSGTTNFTTAICSPLRGILNTNFTFEVAYFDDNNALPPATFPRVYLDYEGNSFFTGGNDRTIIMTPADVNDLNTVDGKRYIGTINSLAYGTNYKTRIQVVKDGVITQIGPFNYPDVQEEPNLQIFANDIAFSTNHPAISSPLTVSTVVHNESDFPAQNFYVHLVNQFDAGQVYSDVLVPYLAPHATTTVSWNITTPGVPAWCPMQVKVDYTNVIAESNELDNSAIRPFINGNYNVFGGIDIANLNTSPEVSYISPGQTIPITISGKGIYINTPAPLLDPSVAGATLTFTVVETGATYSTYTNSQGDFSYTFTSPSTPGVYHIQGQLTDYTFTKNFTELFTLLLYVVPCPTDLSTNVSLIANTALTGSQIPPLTIVQGESISGSVIVYNSCTPVNTTTVLDISQSGGTPAISDVSVPSLASNSTFTTSFNTIVFNTPGTYSICATADSTGIISEDWENNSHCQNITVLPNLPDIYPYTGPGGRALFCTNSNSVSFTLRNGGGAASGAFTCDIIVRKEGVIIDTLQETVANINPLDYYSFTKSFIFPSIGSYTFELKCDTPLPNGVVTEVSESNNTAVYNIILDECIFKPDLTLGSCESFDVRPINPQFPGTVTYVATLINGGNGTATGPIDIRFHLSGGQNYDTQYLGNLAPGQSVEITINAPSVASATQTLTASADFNNLIEEYSDGNNEITNSLCWEFQPVDKLYCGGDFWNQTYNVNQSIYLNVGINQSGMYDASSVAVKYEVTGPGLTGVVNLGNATIQNVEQNCGCPYNAALPYSFVFPRVGTYTFTMTVDPNNVYTECNEGNNVLVRTVNVTNTPDMRVLSQFINPSSLNPDPNTPVHFDVSYENIGTSNIDDTMGLKVLVDEIPLTTIQVSGLGSGDNTTVSIPVTWSTDIVGAHIIRAVIDSNFQINESNEMNNEATRAIVVGKASNLHFATFAVSNPSPALGSQITIDAIIGNQGDLNCQGDVLFYYLNNQQEEIQIGSIHVNVTNQSSLSIQLPWIVLDSSTTVLAKIINASALEFSYDDNEATTTIGGMSLSFTSTPNHIGLSDGTITALPVGGQEPYSYSWNIGYNNQTLIAASGNYTVTITDGTGQTVTGTGTILTSPYTLYYADSDGDGFGNIAVTQESLSGAPLGYVSNSSDCNDANPAIHIGIVITKQPLATDICITTGVESLTVIVTSSASATINYKWQVQTTTGTTWANITNNSVYSGATTATLGIKSATAVMNGYKYRVLASVLTGSCGSATSIVAGLTVIPKSVAGTISVVAGTICSGSSKTLTLNGNLGSIQWQSSTTSSTTGFTTIEGAVSNTYTTPALTTTTYYRAVVTSGICSSITTLPVTILVSPAAIAGTITGGDITICAYTASGTPLDLSGSQIALPYTNVTELNLNGSSGTIIWQKSTNFTSATPTWSSAGSITNTFIATNLTMDTWYRALVTSGVCNVTSAVVKITVSKVAKAGTVTATTNSVVTTSVCSGGNITFTSSAYIGTSIRWEVSTTSATTGFTPVSGANGLVFTINNVTYPPLSKFYVRSVVTSGTCTIARSSVKTITVNPLTVAGTIKGGGTLCANGGATISVTGYVGKIQWEYSTNGINYFVAPYWKNVSGALTYFNPNTTTEFSTAASTGIAATYVFTNFNAAGTIRFRARITSGACSVLYTSAVQYVNRSVAVAGTISPLSATICPSTGTTLTLTGSVGSIQWQKATLSATTGLPGTFANISGQTGVTLATGNLTVATAYQVVVTIGSCSTVTANYVSVFIVAKPLAKSISSNVTSPAGGISTPICTNNPLKKLTIGAGSLGSIQWQTSTTSTTEGFSNIAGQTGVSYVIANPSLGANYYRASFTNSCGLTVYSPAVTVNYKVCGIAKVVNEVPVATTNTFFVVAYPNPTSENFSLSMTTLSDEQVGVKVYDMTGKLIDQRIVSLRAISELHFGDSYPSGIYNVIVTQGSEIKTLRVIKK